MGFPYFVPRIEDPASVQPLPRVPLGGRDGQIDEKWLQRLIDATPEILPISSVDSRIQGRVLALGREIPTAAGPIDNLLIAESGHLVVVETKLWRNPEARRSVVAQILDYATTVREWTYTRLEAIWKQRNPGGGSLHQGMRPEDEHDEGAWVDLVNNRLSAGEMLLLVVGDGIDSRAETLAEVVGGRPSFLFRLALVELQLFKHADGGVLVVPHTLAKTAEIERATVRVTHVGGAQPRIDVDVPTPDPRGRAPSGPRVTLDAQALFADMERFGAEGAAASKVARELLRCAEAQNDLVVEWKPGSYAMKASDPRGDGGTFSLVAVSNDAKPGNVYAYWPWTQSQIARNWGDPAAGKRVAQDLVKLLASFGGRPTASGKQVNIPLLALRGQEAHFVEALAGFVAGLRATPETVSAQ